MAVTNRNRIQQCIDELREGLVPFVEQNLESAWGSTWEQKLALRSQQSQHPIKKRADGSIRWDALLLLKTMFYYWDEVFKKTLGQTAHRDVSELREVRNRFAHEERFGNNDTLLALIIAQRLLSATSASEQSRNLEAIQMELMSTIVESARVESTRNNSIDDEIYARVRQVPEGKVATYNQIAHLVGIDRCSAKRVGKALKALPDNSDVPWHRIIGRSGEIRLRAGSEKYREQRRRLEAEGVVFLADDKIDLEKYCWEKSKSNTRN